MRIGEFSKRNNVTIDTVKHYMNMGLLIPFKSQGQYNFNDECQNALEDIIKLKDSGFTINEIKTIFLFKQLGNLTNYQKDEYYRTLYNTKLENLTQQIKHLSLMKQNVESRLSELHNHQLHQNFRLGLDISSLKYLACPLCKGDLGIRDGQIEENSIINGHLTCSSGHNYPVRDGILIINQDRNINQQNFDEDTISKYIITTDPAYLDNLYKGIEYGKNKLDLSDFKEKVILELGSGMGFFLRNIYKELPENALYIAVDHDLGKQQFLKKMLESADVKKNVMFVYADFRELPLKAKSIEVVLD